MSSSIYGIERRSHAVLQIINLLHVENEKQCLFSCISDTESYSFLNFVEHKFDILLSVILLMTEAEIVGVGGVRALGKKLSANQILCRLT